AGDEHQGGHGRALRADPALGREPGQSTQHGSPSRRGKAAGGGHRPGWGGRYIVVVDVRQTEAAALANEVLLLRPGTDAALALAMMQVIVGEGLFDGDFVTRHTLGFDQLGAHLRQHTPAWAAGVTGISAERIT